MDPKLNKASFRDPAGFVFTEDGVLRRQISFTYKLHYEKLVSSGLLKKLTDNGFLISHEEEVAPANVYKLIKPKKIDFISYPYEWCFSQLKDAALLTLEIQKFALNCGMTLKDASAYNIQFQNGKPILIDTLSFEIYEEGKPWIAYRQFCEHFLAPLALMSKTDARLNQLLKVFLDGVPLPLTSRILPFSSYFNLSLLANIHLHAWFQNKHSSSAPKHDDIRMSKDRILSVVESLKMGIQGLTWAPKGTEWGEYYSDTNYDSVAMNSKLEAVELMISELKPHSVWDLGANTGEFSELASRKGIDTVAFDIDSAAIEKAYLKARALGEKSLLPLVLDLTNPSPSIGWANEERMSLFERGPVDLVLALALVHHLRISNNIPFRMMAEYFSRLTSNLVIEFIPAEDSKVQILGRTRIIPTDYNQNAFEAEFCEYFTIEKRVAVKNSLRWIYLMRKKYEVSAE
ncbi:MAG: class I SAM-dependent methyltransferase [bacterium]